MPTFTSNMNLPEPVIGVDPGPTYGTYQNQATTLIDQHDHSPGKGVQITSAGLNINSDLSINSNNLTNSRTLRLATQSSTPSGALDLGILYRQGVDLFYRDGSGNAVRITQSGGISGTSGSIGGLTSPASATYVSGTPAFVFQSAANTPANLDGGSLTIRKILASSLGITLSPPSGLASNYTLTLPLAPPAATNAVFMDSSGNLSASTNPAFLGSISVVGTALVGTLTIGVSGAILSNNGTLAIIPNMQLGSSSQAQIQALTPNTIAIARSDGTVPLPVVVSAGPSTSGLKIVRGIVVFTTNGAGNFISATASGGEGFTVNSFGTASITLAFSTSFLDKPALTFGLEISTGSFPSGSGFLSSSVATSGAVFQPSIGSGWGGVVTGFLHFIAIGQRA